ncbi:MAG: transporter, partial [Desulfuromonadaceae bacterium]|nr:transporter [Desulfuromonadaceae bacterium]
MSYIKRLCSLLLLLSVLLLSGRQACATEGGGGAYPNGAEDFMSGAVPPPGTYFINYFTYYSADKLADNSGKSALPVFKLNVTADVLRLIHVTDKQILGGFWAMHLFLPIMNVDVTVPGAAKSKTGLGDIIIDPFILSWHGKNWHAATGLDLYIPTGSYDKNDLANVG